MQAAVAVVSSAAALLIYDDQVGDYATLPADGTAAAGLQLPVGSISRLTGQLLVAYQQVRWKMP